METEYRWIPSMSSTLAGKVHAIIAAEMVRDDHPHAVDSFKNHVIHDSATGKPLRTGDTLVGHATVGYGRAVDYRGLTEEEADGLLHNDLDLATGIARGFLGAEVFDPLAPVRKAIVVTMAHEMGAALLYEVKKLRTTLQGHQYEDAAGYVPEVHKEAMRTGTWRAYT